MRVRRPRVLEGTRAFFKKHGGRRWSRGRFIGFAWALARWRVAEKWVGRGSLILAAIAVALFVGWQIRRRRRLGHLT